MAERERKCISVSIENEPLLQEWARKAVGRGDGYLAAAIRMAVEYYLQNKKPLEIARIYPPEGGKSSGQKNFSVYYKQSPILAEWVCALDEGRFSVSRAIRLILAASVTEIHEGNEFFVSVIGREGAVDSDSDFLQKVVNLADGIVSEKQKTSSRKKARAPKAKEQKQNEIKETNSNMPLFSAVGMTNVSEPEAEEEEDAESFTLRSNVPFLSSGKPESEDASEAKIERGSKSNIGLAGLVRLKK